ncbi:hypothetical protein ACOMHN_037329 [Nucella lapillus]
MVYVAESRDQPLRLVLGPQRTKEGEDKPVLCPRPLTASQPSGPEVSPLQMNPSTFPRLLSAYTVGSAPVPSVWPSEDQGGRGQAISLSPGPSLPASPQALRCRRYK